MNSAKNKAETTPDEQALLDCIRILTNVDPKSRERVVASLLAFLGMGHLK